MINFIKTKLLNLYKKLETKEHPLLYLFLEITQICNLDCLHCGSDCQKNMAKDELTTKSWKKIISYIKENFGKNVTFIITGGEPLVHRDLDELTQHIKSENMRWSMVSNGHLLTKERLHTLIGNGLYSITVSLDGSKDIHNYLRNNTHSYARVITALSEIGKSGVLSDVVTCVYPKNLYKLDYIAHILLENNIKNWRLFRIFPSGRAKGNNELLLSYKQTWDMLHWIAEKRPYYKKKGLNLGASCEGFVPYHIDKKIRDFPFFCRAGINFASILCDGTITGCSNNHTSFTQGNIIKDNFIRLWNDNFEEFRKREWVKDTSCSSCEFEKNCKGGSIHLWDLSKKEPHFCYMKENKNVQ